MDGVDGIAFDPRTPESKVQYGTDMILITDETWNLARAEQSQYQKENLRKRKWKLYQIPHKAAQELFANATQFKQEKKKYSAALLGPIVKPSKCCFPWEMSLRELTLHFQFARDILYIREGSRFCLLFPFLPLLFPHPKIPS